MPVKRISPEEAKALVDGEGYAYLDVRSIPEFEAGHPRGAFNVPLNHMGPAGMSPNPEFLSVVEKSFAKDAKLVVGCKGGGRSLRAAELMQAAGYTVGRGPARGLRGPSRRAGLAAEGPARGRQGRSRPRVRIAAREEVTPGAVVVAGGTGALGQALVRHLASQGRPRRRALPLAGALRGDPRRALASGARPPTSTPWPARARSSRPRRRPWARSTASRSSPGPAPARGRWATRPKANGRR